MVATAVRNLETAIAESGAQVLYERLPTMVADGSQLSQVFQNLIGNGIKFRGAEAPVIRIRALQKGREWVFSVADNGIGIAPEHAEVIFAIFKRLHTRAEYPAAGSGWRSARKLSNGKAARSGWSHNPGKGRPSNSRCRSQDQGGHTLTPMKTAPEVLLVDDNPADIDLTSDVLAKSKRHFHVNVVSDGAQAISFCVARETLPKRRLRT